MNFVVIIPARFSSSRFPGKPLSYVNGKPMIVRVMKNALMSNAERVIVATDHIDIVKAVEKEKTCAEVCLTNFDHQSGTERLEEVVNRYGFLEHQIIVNLQGDEPLVSSDMVNQVAEDLLFFNDISMSTLATQITSIQDAYNENVVKVVIDVKNYALYFSRSMIPWNKNRLLFNHMNNFNLLRHIGIYSYRVSFLRRYVNWEVSPLEKIESLEQLRVLWYGEKIHVSIVNNIYCISVDTPEELNKVNYFLRNEISK